MLRRKASIFRHKIIAVIAVLSQHITLPLLVNSRLNNKYYVGIGVLKQSVINEFKRLPYP